MKKRVLAGLAAGALTVAFATTAFAAQTFTTITKYDGTAKYVYANPTPKVFNANGVDNYPYEIYLPNKTNPENYRIHSNYTKNTDACAACHATHTAVGESLLQWYTVYDTCMACHDGTVTTTYNVEEGEIGTTGKPTFGGMFGTGSEGSLSNHNVTGAVSIAAAPGGSVVEEKLKMNPWDADKDAKKRWTPEFGCQSCHSPHGQGGNARILSPDPNFTALKQKQPTYYVSTSNVVYSDAEYTKPVYLIQGYPYSVTVKDNNKVKITGAKIDNSKGYSVVTGVSGAVYAEGVAALAVKMNIPMAKYLKADESVQHVAGMNAFCGACHTDYNTEGYVNEDGEENTGSASAETGTYSKAHRHQVGFVAAGPDGHFGDKLSAVGMAVESDKMECLTCHVAHGVSQDYWKRTLKGKGEYSSTEADTTFVELAGSSALKRQPNMGTCETCHDKSEGNVGYMANTGNGEVPLAATPSIAGDFVGTTTNYVGTKTCANCHGEIAEKYSESFHGEAGQPLSAFGKVYLDENTVWTTQKIWIKVATNKHLLVSKDDVKNVIMGGTYAGVRPDEAVNDAGAAVTLTNAEKNNVYRALAIAEEENTDGTKWYLLEDSTHVALTNMGGTFKSTNTSKVWGAITNNRTITNPNGDCFICHADGLRTAGLVGTESGVVCESCHEGGANHAKSPNTNNIKNPNKLTAAQQIATCGRCHTADNYYDGSQPSVVEDAYQFDNHRGTMNFAVSKHFQDGVTCMTCHSMHDGKGELNTINGEENWGDLKMSYSQLCASCHGFTPDKDLLMPSYYDVTMKTGSTAAKPVLAGDGVNKYGKSEDPAFTETGHNMSRDHGFGVMNRLYPTQLPMH